MQRITPVNNRQCKVKPLLESVRQAMEGTPNMFRAIANAPAALEGYLNFSTALRIGVLSLALREQLALAVAGFNGCDYRALAHKRLLIS